MLQVTHQIMAINQYPPPIRLTAEEEELTLRVLNSLDKLAACYEDQQTVKRDHPRHHFRQKVLVHIPNDPTDDARFQKNPEGFAFETWSRNLSRGGISIVFPTELQFAWGRICLSPAADQLRWQKFSLAHSSQLLHDFWEYGLRFVGNEQADEN